jgi:hypothetical protein
VRDPHPDVVIDLQVAFATVYARAHYAEDVDYIRPVPPPSLRPADAAWAAQGIARWRAARRRDRA